MRTDHSHRTIREFQPADEADVVEVWHRSGIAAYTFLPTWRAFTLEQARRVFDSIIRPNCAIWVATLDERVVAYLAMKETYIDRLFVDPLEWRKGRGTSLRPMLSTIGVLSSRPTPQWSQRGSHTV